MEGYLGELDKRWAALVARVEALEAAARPAPEPQPAPEPEPAPEPKQPWSMPAVVEEHNDAL